MVHIELTPPSVMWMSGGVGSELNWAGKTKIILTNTTSPGGAVICKTGDHNFWSVNSDNLEEAWTRMSPSLSGKCGDQDVELILLSWQNQYYHGYLKIAWYSCYKWGRWSRSLNSWHSQFGGSIVQSRWSPSLRRWSWLFCRLGFLGGRAD